MHTGDDVRVSTAVSTASAIAKPRICLSKAGIASRIAAMANGGRTSARSPTRTPGLYDGVTLRFRVDGTAAHEIADPLRGRFVVAAAELVRMRFQCRCSSMPASGVAGRGNPSGSMPTTIAAFALRSLREYWLMPLVTTRPPPAARHHGAARAHAEAVDAAAVAAVVHQLVVGRAEDRMAGERSEPRLVDHRLRMLDAEADRKWLRLDEHAGIEQHLEGVARAVADRQHDVPAGSFSPDASVTPVACAVVIGFDQQLFDAAGRSGSRRRAR